jgi:hypothetical protein
MSTGKMVMNILAHPLYNNGYIIYVMDKTGRPIEARETEYKNDISKVASELTKNYDIKKAEYIEDYRINTNKPRWKILLQ